MPRNPLRMMWTVCLIAGIGLGCGTVTPATRGRLLILSNLEAPRTQALRQELQAAFFEVDTVDNPAVLETGLVHQYDGLVLDYRGSESWPPERQHALCEYVAQGRGLVLPRIAGGEFPEWDEYRRMVALTPGPESRFPSPRPIRLQIEDSRHPATSGLQDIQTTNAPLSNLRRYGGYRLLASALIPETSASVPAAIAKTYGEGRVFHITLAYPPLEMGSSDGLNKLFLGGVGWAVRDITD